MVINRCMLLRTVKLHVTSTNRIVNTSNVIGFIEGAVEPGGYIMLY